jgi:hypothetical protein
MEKHLKCIEESYNALVDAYASNDAIKQALNKQFAKVVTAIDAMSNTDFFSEEEVASLRQQNQKCWNATYIECVNVSKKAYTLKIKEE